MCVCVYVCEYDFNREKESVVEACKSICMSVRYDRCDRCDRRSGTARCCCDRGQVPACHWSVLMVTQGGGCTNLIDRKMAASRVCRWCLFFASLFCAFFVSISPSTIYYIFQSEYQAAPHSLCCSFFLTILTQRCPLVNAVFALYMHLSKRSPV